MAISIRAFNIELYQEHLEEASFLYEQRLSLLNDSELCWKEIDEFEQRLEAHIDALVVGENLALDVCKDQAEEGDFGELFTSICVFCRQNKGKYVADIFEKLEIKDQEQVRALTDALKWECPNNWLENLRKLMLRGHENSIPVLAELFGYRRFPVSDALLEVLPSAQEQSMPIIIRALGRLRDQDSEASMKQFLRHDDIQVCSESFLALLRLGSLQSMRQCLLIAQSKPWPYIGLGLSGDQSVVKVLLTINNNQINNDYLISLGFLGDLSAVPILISHLDIDNFAGSAATALQLITGAELYEEVFIPEEIDEAELFEEELKAYKDEGVVPLRHDGEPFGITENRVSQDSKVWKQWLDENKSNFKRELRYRNGEPVTLSSLLDSLQSERFIYQIRQMVYEELVIRYEMDIPFEADLSVRKQLQLLPRITTWILENDHKFKAGQWYFAGKLMS